MYKNVQPPRNPGAPEISAHCPRNPGSAESSTIVFNHPEILELPKALHIVLEVFIYRLSNVGHQFINCVVDSQNSSPIGLFVAT